MSQPVRIALVDDHDLMIEGLVALLRNNANIEVKLTASSVAEFRESAPSVELDLVLTDLALGDGSGEDIAHIAHEVCECPVLLMTGQGDADGVRAAVESGCVGFVSKNDGVPSLVAAIRIGAAGGTVFPAELLRAAIAADATPPHDITERETDVLQLLATGANAADIADDLAVSVHTVRNHIRSLLSKLHARSQLEAVVLAVRRGLVTIE